MFDDALFHLIALAVSAWGVLRGYRRGLTGVITSVLGMAFGIVCSHIFADAATDMALGIAGGAGSGNRGYYLASNLGCGAVFLIVYLIFRSLTGVIKAAMESTGGGLADSLLGSAFCLYNYLLMLSIGYNVFVGLRPESSLMKYGKDDDGNICAAVMWIAPAALGSESFAEFAHQEQLREAKKISCNLWPVENVLRTEV